MHMTTMIDPRPLTPKRLYFVELLATGVTQAEAYRRAYPAAQRWADSAVWSRASRVAGDARVRARLAELRAQGAESAVFSLADHLRNLERLSLAALKARDFNAAVRAEEARGKAAGFYVHRHE